MKNRYSKKRYKLNAGVQQITPDTPDYSEVENFKLGKNAQEQGIKNATAQFSGAYAPIGQIGGMAGDVIKSRNKSKGGAQLGGAVSMGASGAALGMQLGGPWGAAIGAVGGGIYGAVTGGKEYEKGKKLQEKAELDSRWANAKKGFKEGTETDAQSALAKKGKYKLKSKQPRMIETEGREPIFSPKKADGTRDLLYYNPNDPTHDEGGVKAVVMPKAQKGKKSTKPFTWKPSENVSDFEQAKRMASNKSASYKQKQKDSLPEDLIELVDPSGTLSYDDVMRSYDRTGLSKETAIEAVGALPLLKYMKLLNAPKTAYKEYMLSRALRYAGKGAAGYQAKEMSEEKYNKGTNNLMPKRPASKYSLVGNGMMAVGSKQLKVNTLNDTALSSNLTGMPAVNAANKFIQPTAGISQVARNIPEVRRKEKINTPRSHKKVNPDLNKIVDPPIPNELKPKPEKSRYEKGGKYIKVYAEGSKGVSLAFSRGEKDPKGGLTQKGVDKYNRATGGNLKMAVTTPPSKLKAGSKPAKRRASFCSRMSGVKGPMKKPNGEPSRKALALRKWNC